MILLLLTLTAQEAPPKCKIYQIVTGAYVVVCDKELKDFKKLHPKT